MMINVSVDRGHKGATLARLMADPRTQVQTFRVRTFNNVAIRQSSETSEFQVIGNGATPDAKLPVQRITRRAFTATPTINQDGTITVALTPDLSTRFTGEDLAEAQQIPVSQRLESISNVKDGETLVVGGLKVFTQPAVTGIGAAPAAIDGNKASRALVILVTPRIVHSDKVP
jgi:hypothetical protein